MYAPICVILATFATEFELRFILTAARNAPHQSARLAQSLALAGSSRFIIRHLCFDRSPAFNLLIYSA